MIKRLRRKLTILLMSIFSIVMIVILVGINYANYQDNNRNSMYFIDRFIQNEKSESWPGKDKGDKRNFPKNNTREEAVFRLSQFYTAKVDNNGVVTSIINKTGKGYTDDEIKAYANIVLTKGKEKGFLEGLLYAVSDTSYGKAIVFIDNRIAEENIRTLIIYSIIVGIIGLIILFIISIYLSRWIVKPVEEAFEKQKRFISDASHELKTPLTVIRANTDILETDIGDNKWLKYINLEVGLMDNLVNKLLILAKVESGDDRSSYENIDFSKSVRGAAMPFESVAFEKGKNLNIDVETGIQLYGDRYAINQLVAILVDNAIKHTAENGTIEVKAKSNRGTKILEVSNTGAPIPEEDRERIFERFYRGDKSRNRSSRRYGLGLAIAKIIVEQHKGTITVECKEGWTRFIVIFNK